ncbi:MAG: isoleucine--tRNA ligase [Clostridia bacterium]|nr:isoleucine--tRNA ligase [Clostridia bacterium]MBR3552623.1 isoleucine--tRNA ligase [Clostridia bacterium]
MAEIEKSNSFIDMEHRILDFWEKNDCFGKRQAKNAGKERFRFIDGPITANNPMGIHHAWGRTLKDTFIRYQSMRGKYCRCQNGFDSQGLWVEVEVEKQLGFATKKDIENYGMDKFTEQCKERVRHFSGIITEQSKRLGQWMQWDNSYFTNTDVNIGGIWHFLKKCDDNGWIQREYKPMPWCPRCGTSLSEHEMTGSYKNITHNSVFFKLPIVGSNSKIMVWTTTPWTLSSNVALAVNPEIDYVEVKVKSDEGTLFLAKNAIKYLGDDKEAVLRMFKGSELVGLEYETCFPEFEKQQGFTHRIVAWSDVDAEEGVGVVHIAPGCGIEDNELGKQLGLPEVMPVDDMGVILPGFGFMTGHGTGEVAQLVFDELEARGKLYKIVPIEHSYPVCWRCKSEVIFRLVPAWYIRTAELKPRLIKAANAVKWEPESNGKRMIDWLNNMGDWNISRKRYYGMPLPFYVCETCGHVHVIGSKAELRERAVDPAQVDALPELHRPWIDEIKIKCPKCGAPVQRISEIGDVWLDAGIVPFSTTGYFSDKEEWKKNYPADWVVEMREQVRLWFYSLLFMSVVLEDRAPYERVLCHSSVVQESGAKFSKTGFMIRFDEAAEKIGADTVRYMYAGAPVANDVRFGFNLGDEARRKLLSFWNAYTFFETYAKIDKPNLEGYVPDKAKMTVTDKWLVIRTNEFLKKATAQMDDFKAYNVIKDFEIFVDDISNWYIRTNRRRFWKTGDEADKTLAYWVLFHAIRTCALVMAPIIPFMTEEIWQTMIRRVTPDAPLSIHLADWPKPLEGFADDGILQQTADAREVIAVAMRLRNEHQIKVRQPLATLFVACDDAKMAQLSVFEKNILDELNIKTLVHVTDTAKLEDSFLTLNFRAAGAVLKQNVNRMKQALEAADADEMASYVAAAKNGDNVLVKGFDEAYPPAIFNIATKTKAGIVSTETADKTVVALDVVLTDALVKEGIVRDTVRQCQLIRKEAGYEVEQHITLSLTTADAAILAALKDSSNHMAAELLADTLSFDPISDADLSKDVDIADAVVTIGVKKA